MPYIKPGEMLGVQRQIVELMEEFKTVHDMYGNGEFNAETMSFLARNPVNGDMGQCNIVKVNGVYVDLDEANEAEVIGRPIDNIGGG